MSESKGATDILGADSELNGDVDAVKDNSAESYACPEDFFLERDPDEMDFSKQIWELVENTMEVTLEFVLGRNYTEFQAIPLVMQFCRVFWALLNEHIVNSCQRYLTQVVADVINQQQSCTLERLALKGGQAGERPADGDGARRRGRGAIGRHGAAGGRGRARGDVGATARGGRDGPCARAAG